MSDDTNEEPSTSGEKSKASNSKKYEKEPSQSMRILKIELKQKKMSTTLLSKKICLMTKNTNYKLKCTKQVTNLFMFYLLLMQHV